MGSKLSDLIIRLKSTNILIFVILFVLNILISLGFLV
jgi:hypothetical protein